LSSYWTRRKKRKKCVNEKLIFLKRRRLVLALAAFEAVQALLVDFGDTG
jgi:hypothetical protein